MEIIHLPAISQKLWRLIDNGARRIALRSYGYKQSTMEKMGLSFCWVLYIYLIYTETIILFALGLNAQ